MNRKTVRSNKPTENMKVKVGSRSDIGLVRQSNQDVALDLVAPYAPLEAECLMIVADGMGGHAAGEVASSIAVDELVKTISSSSVKNPDVGLILKESVTHANAAVYEAGKLPENRGMGTTLTAALVVKSKLYVANVGDSRCYLLRNGKLKQITEDHSFVSEKVRSGELTPEEARNHPYRNVITRAIGLDLLVKVDIFTETLSDKDSILLCSDGLYPLVSDVDIIEILTNNKPPVACDRLIAKANAHGGNDNITVAIGIVEKKGSRNRSTGRTC